MPSGFLAFRSNKPHEPDSSHRSHAAFSVLAGGTRPLAYQWRFNATAIPAATGSAFSFINAQVTNSGSYDVVITNLYGSTTSFVAALTVMAPPQIINQPQHQTVVAGTRAIFSVGATGSFPLRYQWSFNGTALSLATNPRLC